MTTHPALSSKLPELGTSIFTEMSALAKQYGALNLSQGFPDFAVSPELIDRLHFYLKEGYNQYAPMAGLPQLRQAIAAKLARSYALTVNADTEITITAGATEALFCVIAALVQPGQEAIILEPAYDSYGPAVQLQGGKPTYVALNPTTFAPDWAAIEAAFSPATRLFILNTPHNPSGSVWQAKDMEALENLLARYPNCWVLSDEVYEHIIFDQLAHESILKYPKLRQRAAAVFSFGKTFHATGWKVGYVVAPPELTAEVRKLHQYLTFSVHTPTQAALADYLQQPENYTNLGRFYQQKRDYLLNQLKGTKLVSQASQGTYFQLIRIPSHLTGTDREVAHMLTKKHGLATIPLSPFYHNGYDPRLLRLCFAKNEETLHQAAQVLVGSW